MSRAAKYFDRRKVTLDAEATRRSEEQQRMIEKIKLEALLEREQEKVRDEWHEHVRAAEAHMAQVRTIQTTGGGGVFSSGTISSGTLVTRSDFYQQIVHSDGRTEVVWRGDKPPQDGYAWEYDIARMCWVRGGVAHSPPTNTIKPTIHKAGHFPIGWMMEAFERAEQSEKLITVQLEKDGVTVIGEEAGNYETHTLSWTMMEKAEVNPVLLGIETVEKHLDTLARLKDRVKVA